MNSPSPPLPSPPPARIHLSTLQLDCNHISSAAPSAIITIKSQQLFAGTCCTLYLCTCSVNTTTS
ncbi:unnamed protein product, partial [Sphagnum tenellum]